MTRNETHQGTTKLQQSRYSISSGPIANMISIDDTPDEDLKRTVKAVDAIAAKLQWVLVDTDTIFHNKTRPSHRMWKLRCRMTLFIYVFFSTLFLVHMALPSDGDTLNIFADVWRFYSGMKDRRMYSVPTVCFTFTGLYTSLFVRTISKTSRGEFVLRKMLDPLRVLKGEICAAEYGISQQQLKKLRRHAIIGQKIAQYGLYGIVMGLGNYYVYMLATKIDWGRYPQAAIVALLAQFWVYSVTAVQCFMALYFYLICRMLTYRANNFASGYKSYKDARHVFKMHHELSNTILTHNTFWSRYIFGVHVSFLPTISTLAYMVFIIKLDNFLIRMFLTIGLVESCAFLTFTCLSAARLSKAVTTVTCGQT